MQPTRTTSVTNPRTKAEFRRFYEILAERRRQVSRSGRYTPPENVKQNER